MNIKKKYFILISFFVIFLIIILIYLFIYNKDNSSTSNMLLIGNVFENREEYIETSEKSINSIDNKEYDEYSDEYNDEYNDDLCTENNSSINNDDENEDFNVYSSSDVIKYFSDALEEVIESSSFQEKFKEYFIKIIDFIFYDKEIKGYTFSELSDITKTKIIAIALKIDSKLDKYVPNYKENISSTGIYVYSNIKEMLVTLYMDISIDICDNNYENCEKVKEIFEEIKEYCNISWDFIKGLLSNSVSKLKNWYEIYSGK